MWSPGIKTTALAIAFVRASEMAVPRRHRLFEDRFASAFLGPGMRASLLLLRSPTFYAAAMRARDRQSPGGWGGLLLRTRHFDEAVISAISAGAEQVVILGAGADCRGFRLPGIGQLRVFEVDHPTTQRWKRRRLARVLSPLPSHVTFVPVDFERDELGKSLDGAGYDDRAPTCFLWEGVTQYLHTEAVDATLAFVRRQSAAGSRILFSYADQRVLDDPAAFGLAPMLRMVALQGEPWLFGLHAAEVPAFLAERGLAVRDHVGADELRDRYVQAERPLEIWEAERHVVAAPSR